MHASYFWYPHQHSVTFVLNDACFTAFAMCRMIMSYTLTAAVSTTSWIVEYALLVYCITLFFLRILISRSSYVENLLHFNFADFPGNFIKQFICRFFWCIKLMLLWKFVPHYCLHYIIPRILHIISRKSWYSMQINCSSKNLRVFNSRFYSYRENLMLAKY